MSRQEEDARWKDAAVHLRNGDFAAAWAMLRPMFDEDQACDDTMDIVCAMRIGKDNT